MVDPQRNLTFRGTHTVKMVTERVLRSIFAADTMDKRYRYSNVEKQSKVRIYRGYPKRLESYPTITISVGGFPVKMQAFDGTHELMSEHPGNDDLPIEVAGGMVTMPVKLKVFCKGSSDDRENLTDILIMILRIFNRADFQKFGWVNMSVEGEGQFVDVDKEVVFTNAVTFEAQTDYIYQMLPQETDTFIESIVTNVIPVLNFDPEPLPPPPPPNAPVITLVPGQIYAGVPAVIQGINFLGTEVLVGAKLVPATVSSPTSLTFIPPDLAETGLIIGEPFALQVNFSGFGLISAPTSTQYENPPPLIAITAGPLNAVYGTLATDIREGASYWLDGSEFTVAKLSLPMRVIYGIRGSEGEGAPYISRISDNRLLLVMPAPGATGYAVGEPFRLYIEDRDGNHVPAIQDCTYSNSPIVAGVIAQLKPAGLIEVKVLGYNFVFPGGRTPISMELVEQALDLPIIAAGDTQMVARSYTITHPVTGVHVKTTWDDASVAISPAFDIP
jgi:hypothetical protein